MAKVFMATIVADQDEKDRPTYLLVLQEPGAGFIKTEGTLEDLLGNLKNFIQQ